MFRKLNPSLPGLALLALLAVLIVPGWSQPPPDTVKPPPKPDERPAFMRVLLPADAMLEVQGYMTKSTGSDRRYVSPPLVVGKEYTYTLKWTWKEAGKDKSDTRDVTVKAGEETIVDLRKPAMPPPPAGSFTLEGMPAALTLKAGESKTLSVRIKRDNFKDAVEVTVTGAPAKVKAGSATIASGKDSVDVAIIAEKDAADATGEITVHAKSGTAHQEAKLKLTVSAAPKAALKTTAPDTVSVDQGGKKSIDLKVTRENLTGAVTVKFTGLPAGVTIKDVTIAADKDTGTAEVVAADDAKEGDKEVTATFTAGEAKAEAKIKITVKKKAAEVKASLKTMVPTVLSVEQGGKTPLTVKIAREGFEGVVRVKLEGLPTGVTAKNAVIAADKNEAIVDVEAAKEAKEGDTDIMVVAEGVEVKAPAAKLRLTVKKGGG